MTPEHYARLENLIVALRDADPAMFHMSDYGSVIYRDGSDGAPCMTPCCVFGHYAARTDLQDAFTLEPPRVRHSVFVGVHTRGVDGERGESVEYDDRVVCDHFGLTLRQACELFGGDGCGGATHPDEAIGYIRGFIDRCKAVASEGQPCRPCP